MSYRRTVALQKTKISTFYLQLALAELPIWFLTEEIQYHDGLRSRELGQAPILLCAPNS